MRPTHLGLLAAGTAFSVLAVTSSASERAAADGASPIFGVTIPQGYRQWELVAPSEEADPLNELRAILGNAVAIKAFRDGTLPFPDGTILAKLAWKHVPSAEFGPASVPGAATTVQIMVKDSKKYADTGGWGFGRFVGGKPVDEAQHQTCFPCHAALVQSHDFVFTRFAP
jgi:Cytochrome P460